MHLKGKKYMSLNKRERILVSIFVNLFVILMYHIYIYNPMVSDIESFKNIKEQEEYNMSLKSVNQNKKTLLKNLNQETIINTLAYIFPKSIQTNSIKFQEIEDTEKYKFVNIEIQVIGNTQDILKGIEKIDNSDASIYIQSIMLDNTKDYVICTLYLSVYSL